LIGNDLRNNLIRNFSKVAGKGFILLSEDNEGKVAPSSSNIKERKRIELFNI
jgi:hypothetical protein